MHTQIVNKYTNRQTIFFGGGGEVLVYQGSKPCKRGLLFFILFVRLVIFAVKKTQLIFFIKKKDQIDVHLCSILKSCKLLTSQCLSLTSPYVIVFLLLIGQFFYCSFTKKKIISKCLLYILILINVTYHSLVLP